MSKKHFVVIAEFSIHPIGVGTSVGKYVRAAVKALSELPDLKYRVTPMSTVLEAENISIILRAVKVSHEALRALGAKRISSSLRIDQRLDKRRTMTDKIHAVKI